MLFLFTGTPGSGKSLDAARIIRRCLSVGRKRDGRPVHPVIANFDINPDTRGFDCFTYCPNNELTPDFLYSFADGYWDGRPVKEETIYLFVDEAQLIFNSRDWSQNDRMSWIEFLSQHRHYGYRIYFMCQFDRMIDRQIRSLAEYEVKHRKVSSFGIKGKLIRYAVLGELFCAVTVYYGMNEKTGAEFYRASKSLFRLYDSYSRFRRVGSAEGGGSGVPRPMRDGTALTTDDADKGDTRPFPAVVERLFAPRLPRPSAASLSPSSNPFRKPSTPSPAPVSNPFSDLRSAAVPSDPRRLELLRLPEV